MNRVVLLFISFLVFTVPWENMIVLPGLGTMSRVVGLVCAMFGVACILSNKRGRPFKPFISMFGVLFLWNIATYFWTVDPEASLIAIKTMLQMFVFVWLIWEFARNEKQQNLLLSAYVLGAYISAFSIIYSYMRNQEYTYFRYSATGFDPNDIGLILAIGVPIAWYLSISQNITIFRYIYQVYIFVAFWAILLTASRGSFAAYVVALSYVIISINEISFKSRCALFMVVCTIAIYASEIAPARSIARISSLGTEISSMNFSSRYEIWKKGFFVFGDHPILGVGAGGFNKAIEPYLGTTASPHNFIMSVIVEKGLVGLIIFILIIYFSITDISRMTLREKKFWLILMGTWFVGVLNLGWEYRKTTWLLFILLACHANAAQDTRCVYAKNC